MGLQDISTPDFLTVDFPTHQAIPVISGVEKSRTERVKKWEGGKITARVIPVCRIVFVQKRIPHKKLHMEII